jgi:chromosome segregation ATPase
MSTPYSTVNSGELRRLTEKVRQIDAEIDSVRMDVEGLERQVRNDGDEHRGQLREHTYSIEQLQSEVSTVETELASLARDVAKVADRSAWMERHIRASGTARVADFDTIPPSVRLVVKAVHHGHQLTDQLMPEPTRWSLEFEITQAEQRHQRIEEFTAAALAANKVLVSTPFEASAHLDAADAFRTAFVERQKLVGDHIEKAATVQEARVALAAANKLRDTNASRIAAGDAAQRSLRTRMRTIVAEAIGDGALPPVWFSTALGVTAPRNRTDDWLDLAADVLAHRVLYAVTDPLLALGPPPDRKTHPHQATAHDQLTARLRNL